MILSLCAFAQNNIESAFKLNEAQLLKNELANSIELSLLEIENIFNKEQAIIVIQEFMNQDKCQNFLIKHQSKYSKQSKTRFIIGEYVGEQKTYRCHFLIKDNGDQIQIIELRIELQDE